MANLLQQPRRTRLSTQAFVQSQHFDVAGATPPHAYVSRQATLLPQSRRVDVATTPPDACTSGFDPFSQWIVTKADINQHRVSTDDGQNQNLQKQISLRIRLLDTHIRLPNIHPYLLETNFKESLDKFLKGAPYSQAGTRIRPLDTRLHTLDTRKDTQKNAHKGHLGELTTKNMDTIVDCRTKYRFGSPLLPTLPVETYFLQDIEDKFPGSDKHRRHIVKILVDYDIQDWSYLVAYRYHEESELCDQYVTIVVTAEYQPGSEGSEGSEVTWPKVVKTIREYLNGESIDIAIELIDNKLFGGLESFPITTDIYQWNDVLLPLISDLLNGHQWITLTMVNREDVESPGNRRPTILIGARDADEQSWWNETLPTLQRLRQVAEYDIQIELMHQQQVFTASPDGSMLKDCFRRKALRLGASCGTAGTTRSGTLGGSLRLLNPDTGAEQTFGLTNHHVLGKQLVGDGPFTKFEKAIIVESPSSADRDFFVNGLKKEIESFTDTDDEGNDSTVLKGLETELKNACNMDLTLGHVFASSGFRSEQKKSPTDEDKQQSKAAVDEWALDWCLTTVEDRVFKPDLHDNRYGNKKVLGYCSLNPNQGYSVFKKGRTSGGTTGFISATDGAYRKVPEPEDGPTALPRDISMFSKPVRVHVLIDDRTNRGDGEFIKRGDSGSLVFLDPHNSALPPKGEKHPWKTVASKKDDLGEVLIAGLAFGCHSHTRLSYMIPMDMVVQDVQSVTQCTVVEPKFVPWGEGEGVGSTN
jgi:hypothetical protein